jgi:NADPH-dependent ferric siderophore reductase
MPSRGFQGAVLKLLRAGDDQLTVTGRRELIPHYLRLSVDAGGLLNVDPNPDADTVDIEFALHDGVASGWAQDARPGDTIEVTVLGSNFTPPEPAPNGLVIVDDTATLPAINSLLTVIGDTPARVILEAGHDDDTQLAVAQSAHVVWVHRKNGGEALVQAVSPSAFDAADHLGWVSCDN